MKGYQITTMTDDNFLAAMKITNFQFENHAHILAEALRIDDLRSTYCEQLELRIAAQAAEIRALRGLLGLLRQP